MAMPKEEEQTINCNLGFSFIKSIVENFLEIDMDYGLDISQKPVWFYICALGLFQFN